MHVLVNMSSEASFSSYEVVDVVKEDGPKYEERSYYPSQIPVDTTDRVESSSQERLSSSRKPTECTSGAITGEITTIEAPKVEELAEKLLIATGENEKLRTAMEDCNDALRRNVEALQNGQREMENMRTMLGNYKVKNSELEERNKLLQDQLSTRVCVYNSVVYCSISHMILHGHQN